MRELKFRAWDKIHDKYREPMVYDILNEKIVVRFPIETLKKGEFLLEQSTALRDKNGVEIYEGDVVSEHNGDIIGKIVRSISGEWRVEWMGIFGGSSVLYDETSMCEVIGTIHERSAGLARSS